MAEDALAQYADQLIYLCSAQASSQLIIVAQRKVETQIDALKLEHVKIDGMVEENKPARAAIWKKVDAKPGTYPIVLNMKTGDFWHGDDLQATQRHTRALLLILTISPITAFASLQNAIDADEFQEKLSGFIK